MLEHIAFRLSQKAAVLIAIEEYIEAEKCLNEAIPILETKHDITSLAICYNQLGHLYYKEALYKFAEKTYRADSAVETENISFDQLEGIMGNLADGFVLMAVDSLKHTGMSVDVFAWNVSEDANITKFLNDKNASTCDIIIGPLYSKQVAPLATFASKHDIKVLIPFSINAPELFTNSNLFQVYQSPTDINEATIDKFLQRFAGYNTVIIDCNDTTSKKGVFTMGLRRRMETMGREYNITNLKSSEPYFAKAFSKNKPNVVILNTGRSPELNLALAKLNNFSVNNPDVDITMFGYTEWMMYTKYDIDNYYKYNVYIPATFYLNPLSSSTDRIMTKYRWNFHTDMMQALPRFAVTGFDHAMFFLKGFYKQGKKFTGAPGSVGYIPVQTPLKFEKIANGGYRNTSLLFVHYKPTHQIETINY